MLWRLSRGMALILILLLPLMGSCGCGDGISPDFRSIAPGTKEPAAKICDGEEPDKSVFVAVGASFTMGLQNGCLVDPMQLQGLAALVARQLNADFPQPVFVAEEGRKVCAYIAADGVPTLDDLGLGYYIRLNPEVQNYNIAVAGDTVDGFLNADPIRDYIHTLVLDPLYKTGLTQASLMERLKPTMIISTDLAGNDMLNRSAWSAYKSDYTEAIRRMSATGADFFVANQMDITALNPDMAASTKESIRNEIKAMNQEIKQIVEDDYGGHVVDFFGAMEQWDEGISMGGVTLNYNYGGGIISLDTLHPTSVGYALLANLFIDKINQVYHCGYPKVDVAAVLEKEPYSPKTISCRKNEAARYQKKITFSSVICEPIKY
jgi:hypothetical protein